MEVVKEYNDVFPDELSVLSPPRQEYQIDLISGDALIAKAPYQLSPLEMKQMMSQI